MADLYGCIGWQHGQPLRRVPRDSEYSLCCRCDRRLSLQGHNGDVEPDIHVYAVFVSHADADSVFISNTGPDTVNVTDAVTDTGFVSDYITNAIDESGKYGLSDSNEFHDLDIDFLSGSYTLTNGDCYAGYYSLPDTVADTLSMQDALEHCDSQPVSIHYSNALYHAVCDFLPSCYTFSNGIYYHFTN